MGERQGVVQREGLLRQRQRPLQGILRVRTPVKAPLPVVASNSETRRLPHTAGPTQWLSPTVAAPGHWPLSWSGKTAPPPARGIIGLQVVGVFTHDLPLLLHGELQFQRRHDLLHDLVLQGKDVLKGPVDSARTTDGRP